MGSLRRQFLILVVCCILSPTAVAQELVLRVHAEGEPAAKELAKISRKTFYDSALLSLALDKVVANLHADGYLLATYRDLNWQTDTVTGYLSSGRKYHMIVSGFEGQQNFRRPPSNYDNELREQLAQYLNTGYPFAKIYLDSAWIRNDTIRAYANVQKGPLIVFDTLALQGNTKTRRTFLQKYLMMGPGTPYSEQLVAAIPDRLNGSSFANLVSVPTVDFFAGKARVNLAIEEPQLNQLDGLLGFLPDQNGTTGKLLLTGQAKADLFNLFGTGKHLLLHWQNFNVSSQQLNLAYDHPVLFGSPLALHTAFHQLKQDTTFVTRKFDAGFSFPITPKLEMTFGGSFKRNSLLSANALNDADKLLYADSRINEYGIGFRFSSTDHDYLPSKGSRFKLNVAVGEKDIIRNTAIDAALYEDIELSTFQTSATLSMENYTKLSRNSVFVQQLQLAGLFNKELFQNDLFRLGGLSDTAYGLRGFNENQFFASSLGLLALEWRILLDEQSYLQVFTDQGVFSFPDYRWNYAVGFGTGLVLRVNVGFFRIALAVGSENGQPINFAQPKIHFGFVNRF